MASGKEKLPKAAAHLEQALRRYRAERSELNFLTVAKAFEVLVEYAWRTMKTVVESEGLEAPSPKGAVRLAARLKLVTRPEVWLNAIEARNSSVHDYFGISESEFCALADEILSLLRRSRLAAD